MASTTNTVNAFIIISSLPAQTQLFPDKKRKNPNPFQSSDLSNVAPQVGLEPTTLRLTAACSTD